MITFNRRRIVYDEESSPFNIDGFVILFETPEKGKIRSHLMQCVLEGDEDPVWRTTSALASATMTFDDEEFFGEDILATLHEIYIKELEHYNPDVLFINTLQAG